MKVGIISFGNLREAPYIRVYADFLKENQVEYDLIYWDRNGEEETNYYFPRKTYAWGRHVVNASSLWSKIIKIPAMYKYGKFAESIIREERYDLIIVFTSLLGVVMRPYLVSHMKGKYIFDIRDHSYEQFSLFFHWMDDLMRNSAINVISSIGFKEFLPNHDTIVCHNYSIVRFPNHVKPISCVAAINISYIGLVRYSDQYIDFIQKIGNNQRINFHFYGYGGHLERIKKLCSENDFSNVYFHGPYSQKDKNEILENTDVVFNVYGNDLHVKYAVSNKYYDALVFNRPMIVSPGTTMEKITEGFSFVYHNDFDINTFIKWYDSLDYNNICRICHEKLEAVQEDRTKFSERLKDIINSNRRMI